MTDTSTPNLGPCINCGFVVVVDDGLDIVIDQYVYEYDYYHIYQAGGREVYYPICSRTDDGFDLMLKPGKVYRETFYAHDHHMATPNIHIDIDVDAQLRDLDNLNRILAQPPPEETP